MTLEVPTWVRLACQRWGRQKRRIWSGTGEWYVDRLGKKTRHVDGYAQSFLGRIQDEKVAAGSSMEVRQFFAEVYWGDGLEIQRNIGGMAELPLLSLHMRWVWDPEFGVQTRHKAAFLGVTLNRYWLAVADAENHLWRRLEPPTAQVIEILTPPTKNHTVARATSRVSLSLNVLNRPTLSRSGT